jgi:hypothetical protein
MRAPSDAVARPASRALRSRRSVLRAGAIAAAAIAGGVLAPRAAAAAVRQPSAVPPSGSPWDEARDCIRSGALGTIGWAAGRYTPGAADAPAGSAAATRLTQLLHLFDARDEPAPITTLGSCEPTAILALASGVVLYAAPHSSTAEPIATVRGDRGTLIVHERGVVLTPRGTGTSAS